MGGLVPTPPRRRLGVLSALQQRVAIVLASLPDAEGFALAGGGALIVRGAVDRETHDLDYFVVEADAIDRLVPALEAALTAGRLAVERRQVAHGFARLSITSGDDHTEVDLCVDARLLPTEPSPIGPTLSVEERAANKLLALFSRAEARDFVDFAALEPIYGLEPSANWPPRRTPASIEVCWQRCSDVSTGSPQTSSCSMTNGSPRCVARCSAGSSSWHDRARDVDTAATGS